MPNVVPVGTSGTVAVDSLLHGEKWNTLSLTFSFPDFNTLYPLGYAEPFNNFDTFNPVQQAAVRAIYRQISSFTNLTFTQVAPAAGDLRFAMTDHVPNAHAYYPHPDQKGGDSWYHNSGGRYDDPRLGQKAYQSFLHEIGHTLGLSHPHDETPVMPADRDALEYTVMSYRSYVGRQDISATVNETDGYPQTYMIYDVYALQHMYGANYAHNAGDTVYSWNPATGAFSINNVVQWTPTANRIFMTVWDGNGTDTYDLSSYASDVLIDLRPGGATDTSPAQMADLGNDDVHFARGNVFNPFLFQGDARSLIENAVGGSGHDGVIGNDGANTIDGRAGNDILFGEGGADILIGGTGADRMEGVTGNDVYHVDNAGDVVTELSGQGTDRIVTTITLTLPAHVENLTLAGANPIGGTGNSLANILTGNAAANMLNGGPGNDTLNGGAGADAMAGSTGDDSYHVDHAGDGVSETSATGGTDIVNSAISYTLGSHVEQLVLTGSALSGTGNGLANRITGNAAANLLDGAAGADIMTGGAGNDTFIVDHSGDKAVETSTAGGTDKVRSAVSFTLGSNVEQLALTGTAAVNGTGNGQANTITGNGAANVLKGGAGNDSLVGGGGNDKLYGGSGKDRLEGGSGLDLYHFDTTPNASTNVDQIIGFSRADDTIYLSRAIFAGITATGTLAASRFRVGTAAADASDRIIHDRPNGRIFYDEDGTGPEAQVLFATVAPGTTLTNLDFYAYI